MHLANTIFLYRVAALLHDCILGKDVLEIGSNISMENANNKEIGATNIGAVRRIFEPGTASYTGIDLVPGKGVDIVGNACDYTFESKYDLILNLSVLEHEPRWEVLMRNTLPLMKDGGAYVLTFGAENNLPHLPDPWAFVPTWSLLDVVSSAARSDTIPIHAGFDDFEVPFTDTPGVFSLVLRRGVPTS